MLTIDDLYDLEHTIAKEYLARFTMPWQALAGIKDLILEIGKTLSPKEYDEVKEGVWIHKTAQVFPSAFLGAPCIVGADSQIRPCAFIREAALIGNQCVVGNSCELKNVILFDHVEVPHYNYVGDSILGFHAHLGAGSVTSNVKGDRTHVHVHGMDMDMDTGMKKVGAMLGDYVEVGCNSVLNPGTIVGRHSRIYPLSSVRGIVPADSIYKTGGIIVPVCKREK